MINQMEPSQVKLPHVNLWQDAQKVNWSITQNIKRVFEKQQFLALAVSLSRFKTLLFHA